jgi:predicted AAA+ superfamily ATPase
MQLGPLSFSEYLLARGFHDASDAILAPPKKLSSVLHEILLTELRTYFFVGGMPEAVAAYCESNSIQEAFEVQADICETYRWDFSKYTPRADRDCLNMVLSSIAKRPGQQIKYARLGRDFSSPTLKKAFYLLCMANIIHKVPSASPTGLPLQASVSDKVFKALLVDIGLLRYLSGMPVDVEYQQESLLSIFRGGMAEQFVGQEMLISQNNLLYYWSRQAKSSTAEVDYLCVDEGDIFPVEVKSGSAGSLKSLHLYIEKYKPATFATVFSERPFAELPTQRIRFIPLYYAFSATGGLNRA